MAQVMDDSGAAGNGVPDPGGSRGVVEMPDSESLRRSVAAASAAEQARQAGNASQTQPGFEGSRRPVSANSSGMHASYLLPG